MGAPPSMRVCPTPAARFLLADGVVVVGAGGAAQRKGNPDPEFRSSRPAPTRRTRHQGLAPPSRRGAMAAAGDDGSGSWQTDDHVEGLTRKAGGHGGTLA